MFRDDYKNSGSKQAIKKQYQVKLLKKYIDVSIELSSLLFNYIDINNSS